MQKYVIAKSGETRGSRTALLSVSTTLASVSNESRHQNHIHYDLFPFLNQPSSIHCVVLNNYCTVSSYLGKSFQFLSSSFISYWMGCFAPIIQTSSLLISFTTLHYQCYMFQYQILSRWTLEPPFFGWGVTKHTCNRAAGKLEVQNFLKNWFDLLETLPKDSHTSHYRSLHIYRSASVYWLA